MSSPGAGAGAEAPATDSDPSGREVLLLYAGARDWFRSALEAVLEPEGFDVLWAHDAEEALRRVAEESVDLIIVDENLPDMEVGELCRSLRDGPLSDHVPIVLYASDMSRETLEDRALAEGAWEVIREPIRVQSLVASLRRLLRVADLMGEARDERFTDPETGLLSARGFFRMLPTLGAIAEREGAPLSCAVIGPTDRGPAGQLREQRELTARLCSKHVRQSDLCGWLDEGDVAIVTFDTPPEAAVTMARRLSRLSEEIARQTDRPGSAVSAGIVQIHPARGRSAGTPAGEDDEQNMAVLATARAALEKARQEGGGVRIAAAE